MLLIAGGLQYVLESTGGGKRKPAASPTNEPLMDVEYEEIIV